MAANNNNFSSDSKDKKVNKISTEKAEGFFDSVLELAGIEEIDLIALADFIEKGWTQGLYKSSWISLLTRYNSLEKEQKWKVAFKLNSDKLIIDMWVKFGQPNNMTEEQQKKIDTTIRKYGALIQIKRSRVNNDTKFSQQISYILSPMLDKSDLIYNKKNK